MKDLFKQIVDRKLNVQLDYKNIIINFDLMINDASIYKDNNEYKFKWIKFFKEIIIN